MDENISDSEEIGDNVDVVFEDDENGTHEEPNMDGDDGVDESEGKIIEDDSTSALYAHEKDVFCVEASGTRWIGSGGEDDMAHIWDLSASPTDPVLSIQHNDSVVSIAFNSTGTLVATGDMSGRIFITQLSDLSKRSEISDCSDIEWMFWHKSSDILFVGDSDGSAWMWLISQTGIAQQKVYSSGNATTSSGLLLPDGRRLLVGYDDGTLKLWQLQNQTNSGITCDSAVLSIAHSETQPLAAVGTANGTVYLLNSTVDANLRALKTFATSDPSQAEDMETEETERSVECLTFCKEHSWIAVGRNDGTTIVYETDTHNTRFTHTNETNQAVVKCLWIGYLLAVASVDGTIVIFDARSGNIVKELRCGGDQVLDFSLLQVQPQKLIVACSGGAIRFFDL